MDSYSNKGWKNPAVRNLNNFDPPGLTLHLKLRRTSDSYAIMLFTPFFGKLMCLCRGEISNVFFLVIAVSLLMTFWVSPFGHLKVSLACLQLILASIVLIGLGIIIPIHSQLVPNLGNNNHYADIRCNITYF